MNGFLEFLPMVVFLSSYYLSDIYMATIYLVVSSVLVSLILRFKNGFLTKTQLMTVVLIVIFGSLTIFFKNEIFIKWKPTIINYALAAALLVFYVRGTNLIYKMIGHQISAEARVWKHILFAWVLVLFLEGTLNIYVAYNYPTDVWINFKIFGLLFISIVATLSTVAYLMKRGEIVSDGENDSNL